MSTERVEINPDNNNKTLEQSQEDLAKQGVNVNEGVVNNNGESVNISQPENTSQSSEDKSFENEARPNWLPEKFKSAEELAKAYSELEKKMSAPQEEQTSEPVEEAVEQPQDMQQLDKYYDEFIEKNELSEKSYEELDALGLPRDLVDGYIAGQKALADNDVSEVQNVVGGQDNYAQLLEWSSKNLSQSEKDAFNNTIDNGSTEQVKMAVQGLMGRAGMTADNPQQNLFEGSVDNTNTDVFGSVAQVTDAMNDPRYQKDPAYRKEVEDKLARSSVI
tara:strand:- start:167 stop:994 length:828 start_codon:yes stop_codon:yes gene_type:complete